ncbi:MAG: prepilin-type N-terminal cleavage/methylation domain-containing protein [Phycisphaerales bacterium]|nr:prepilin-type N-terminal cleavage/methylation domain-containing protein [Phycisphaerales bacterium]
MNREARPVRRGFTLIEFIVVLVVLVLLVVILMPASSHHQHNDMLTCQTRSNQLYKGLLLYANDSGGVYPLPMEISPETAAIGAQSGNSSANLLSYMVFETYSVPEFVICPGDPNPNVDVKTDYRYGTQDDPNWNPAWKWDPSFSADITRPGANVSYATLAMIGDRAKNQWRDSLDPNFAVAADRGPRDGVWDAKSLTLLSHGKRDDWTGNVAFNDGSVRGMKFTRKDAAPFAANGDNLFFADDGETGGDMWLGLFGATDETTTTPYWD